MIQAESSHLIITIEKKFTDEVNGIHIDTHFQPQEHVTLQGTVVSVPKRLPKRIDYDKCSLDDILPGDKVMFRYNVIYSYKKQGSSETPIYRNLMFVKGKEYWRCDILNVFGRIRDGKLKMINGNVITTPFDRPSGLILPHSMKRLPNRIAEAEITHIGDNPTISAKVGDTVFFDSKKVQQYKVGHYEFVIMREDQILGKRK